MMKKINLYIIIFFASIFGACDELLTETDPNTITSETFWKTKEDAEKGLNAVYSALQLNGVSGRDAYLSGMVMSDEAIPNSLNGGGYHTMNSLDYYSNDGFIESVWKDFYTGIFRANQLLVKLPDIEMDQAEKSQIEGQARFLRAWFYFWLTNMYNKGEIILHDNVPLNNADFHKGTSPKSKTDSLILSDLIFAQQVLPEVQEEKGRITWGAATALLGKYYLFNENWPKAENQFKAIIDKVEQENLYELVDDYQWNFDEEHEFNNESIFEVSYSSDLKPGMNGGSHDGDNGSEASSIERNLAARQNPSGWSSIVASCHLMIDMMNDPMDLSNPKNAGRKYPIRASSSIAIYDDTPVPYFGIVLPPNPSSKMQFNMRSAGFIRKRVNWQTRTQCDLQNNRSGLNERKIRLADVYLMYSEAVIQNSGNILEAVKYINKVRERAAVVPLDAAGISSTDSVLNHLMFVERPLELSYEGQNIRWHDMRRWGIVGTRLKALSEIGITWEANTVPRLSSQTEIDNGSAKYFFEEAAANYSTNNDFWPIPTSELTSNGAFIQ